MIKDDPETSLNNVDYETQEETKIQPANIVNFQITNDSIINFFLFIFVVVIMFIHPYIVPFLFTGRTDIFEYVIFDPSLFKSVKINLTGEERDELTQKMKKICKILYTPQTTSEYFKPLYKTNQNTKQNLIPLNKISFMISSNPSSSYLCKLYLDIWSTKYGSKIVKNTGIEPYKKIYWQLNSTMPKISNISNYKITVINETNSINKWSFILTENYKSVQSSVEWFALIDDKTLPFLDKIDLMLSKFKDPLKNSYLIRGRKNSESSFYLSRKLVETIIPKMNDKCEKNENFVKCVRSIISEISPKTDKGIFEMNPKLFKGNLTGFIESYFDKIDVKSLRNIHEEDEFYIFPKNFLNLMKQNKLYNVQTRTNSDVINLSFNSFPIFGNNYFSQEAHFAFSAAVSGDMFLKRYIIMFSKNDQKYYIGILNFGYSLVVFDIEYKTGQNNYLLGEVLKYLSGVEKTFTVLSDDAYINLSRLLLPESKKILRYYLKRTAPFKIGFDTFYQEFCSVSSTSIIAKILANNHKISMEFIDYSIFK